MSITARIFGRGTASIEPDNDERTVARPSLDAAADDIARAQNYVVHCEAELERARMRLADAQDRFLEILRDRHLGLETR